MKDLVNEITVVRAINNATVTTNTTTTGVEIDLQNYESCTFLFSLGTLTDGDFTPLITECATSGGSFTAVADADLIGLESGAAFTTDTDDNKVSKLGYKGKLRYVKAAIVTTNVSGSGGTFTALCLKGHPIIRPGDANSQ